MEARNTHKRLAAQLDYALEGYQRLENSTDHAGIRTIISSVVDDTRRHLEQLQSMEETAYPEEADVAFEDLEFPSVAATGGDILRPIFTREKSTALTLARLARSASDADARANLLRMAQESKKLLLLIRDRYDLENLSTV